MKDLQALGDEPFLMPFWRGVNEKIVNAFSPRPNADFLSNRAIIDTMFVVGDQKWLDTQVAFVKRKLGNKFRTITQESAIGKPKILNAPYNFTSHNTIHHLYHLFFFEQQTKIKTRDLSSVVEWGGGYGNFARLWRKTNNTSSTYTIIDSSIFCALQYLYLTSTLGSDAVHILNKKDAVIVEGKINLVPLALLHSTDIRGDLFVSTWGLSESAKEAQDYVVKKKWFGAKHLLIGFQDSHDELPYASRLGELAKKDGAKITDIQFIPHNHYALK
jgi:hypothetical protein